MPTYIERRFRDGRRDVTYRADLSMILQVGDPWNEPDQTELWHVVSVTPKEDGSTSIVVAPGSFERTGGIS
jgi:hypothetical protein